MKTAGLTKVTDAAGGTAILLEWPSDQPRHAGLPADRGGLGSRQELELVELNPLVDPTFVSAMNANRVVRECLTGLAMRKMGLTDPHYLSPLTKRHGQGE